MKAKKPIKHFYTIKLTKQQLEEIKNAAETCARIPLLQFDKIVEYVGKGYNDPDFCAVRDQINEMQEKVHRITEPAYTESHFILWDIYQVTRHRLSWDCEVKPKSSELTFHDPRITSQQPLPEICYSGNLKC